MGPERRSRVITEKEKEIVSYHEAGHALAGHMSPDADPVHKVSIIARGVAGGYTKQLPTEDRHYYSVTQLRALMVFMLGGRAAEELIFGIDQVTNGAQSDLERVSQLARKMVKEWGMSERMGLRTLGHREDLIFLGRVVDEQKDYGDKVADEVDAEISRMIDVAYSQAKDILAQNKAKLTKLAQRLVVEETLEGEALTALLSESEVDR